MDVKLHQFKHHNFGRRRVVVGNLQMRMRNISVSAGSIIPRAAEGIGKSGPNDAGSRWNILEPSELTGTHATRIDVIGKSV